MGAVEEQKRTIIITGASRGIGRFLCEKAQAAGFRVIGIARQFDGTEGFETVQCDVREPSQIDVFCQRLKGDKSLYALVNAAGVLITKSALQYGDDEVAQLLSTNLAGPVLMCRRLVRLLLPMRKGRIINISSIAAAVALKGDSVYSASKAGLETYSRALAREIAERGITVNCVAPGPVPTEMIKHLTQEQIDSLVGQQIIQKQASLEDLWPPIEFLLSDGSAMVTGQTIHIGGI